jgi:hypothetical protein
MARPNLRIHQDVDGAIADDVVEGGSSLMDQEDTGAPSTSRQ